MEPNGTCASTAAQLLCFGYGPAPDTPAAWTKKNSRRNTCPLKQHLDQFIWRFRNRILSGAPAVAIIEMIEVVLNDRLGKKVIMCCIPFIKTYLKINDLSYEGRAPLCRLE